MTVSPGQCCLDGLKTQLNFENSLKIQVARAAYEGSREDCNKTKKKKKNKKNFFQLDVRFTGVGNKNREISGIASPRVLPVRARPMIKKAIMFL